jgi:uncharacterized membrane protein YoaK (UPF0700 family)
VLPSWVSQVSGGEALLGVLLLLVAFFAPVVGVFIIGLIAIVAHRNDETVQRNISLVALAVAFIVLLLISFVPETWDELLPNVDRSGPLTGD